MRRVPRSCPESVRQFFERAIRVLGAVGVDDEGVLTRMAVGADIAKRRATLKVLDRYFGAHWRIGAIPETYVVGLPTQADYSEKTDRVAVDPRQGNTDPFRVRGFGREDPSGIAGTNKVRGQVAFVNPAGRRPGRRDRDASFSAFVYVFPPRC